MADLTVVAVDPDSPDGRDAIDRFFAEIVGRRLGRPATAEEIASVVRAEPSGDLHGGTGFFVLVRDGGTTVGCGGVRVVDVDTGEVSRVFVDPAARGRGVATALLRDLEERARNRGLRRLRLTVRDDLVEARSLYERSGFHAIEAFGDSPYADHFLAKDL